MFPRETVIRASSEHPGRDILFDRVDHFSLLDSRQGEMLVRSLRLGDVTVATVRSSGHDIALDEPGRLTMLAPLRGRIGVETRRDRLETPAGGALFLRSGYRTTRVRPDRGQGFLAAVALAPARRALSPAQGFGRAFAPGAASAEAAALQGFLGYFVVEYARPGSPLRRRAALRAAEALILDLTAALEAADLPPSRTHAAPEARVRLAEEIMRARFDEPLTTAGIAREVGVGARALQAAFHAVHGVTPRAMLAAHRLDRARERLLCGEPGGSVTDVALACGIAHFGRFAAAYRARFGESPSETLRRARG